MPLTVNSSENASTSKEWSEEPYRDSRFLEDQPLLLDGLRAEDVVECCDEMAKDGDYKQDSPSTWSRRC